VRVSCVDCIKSQENARQSQFVHMMIMMVCMLKPPALRKCGDGLTPKGIGGRAGVGEARS